MPAAKSIEIQEKNEYSGLLSLLPSLMLPNLLNIRYTKKITNKVTPQTYTQLRLTNIKPLTASRIRTVNVGRKTDNRHTPIIKIRLGTTIPLLKVDFDKIIQF